MTRSGSDTEKLWSGRFGDEYAVRNSKAAHGRGEFWHKLFDAHPFGTALEVGCNIGANLRWLVELVGAPNVAGIDVNESALAKAARHVPGATLKASPGGEIPFPDGSFDLVFTTGVLIHINPSELESVMREIVRCSARYVLCGEYYAASLEEVPYRGHRGALWKQDFGGLYQRTFPQLKLVEQGFLPASEGVWDDVTYWVFDHDGQAPPAP